MPYLKSEIFRGRSPILIAFNTVNQSFFMGLFFWLSGRMSAQSLARSSPGPFLRDKLVRLGLPALAYTLISVPLTLVIASPHWDLDSASRIVLDYWGTLKGVKGSAWYAATLLVFDSFAALLAWRARLRGESSERGSGSSASLLYRLTASGRLETWGWLGVAVTSFLIRTRFPLGQGKDWTPLNLNLSHAPQYIFAYVLGYQSFVTSRPRLYGPFGAQGGKIKVEARRSDVEQAGMSLPAAILVSLATLTFTAVPVILTSGLEGFVPKILSLAPGGWNTVAFLYALWNEFSFAIIAPALMVYFQQWHNQPVKSWWWQPRYSYATYLIHNLVGIALGVGIEVLFQQLASTSADTKTTLSSAWWKTAGPPTLTAAVGMTQLFLSFAAAGWLVRNFPSLRKIL